MEGREDSGLAVTEWCCAPFVLSCPPNPPSSQGASHQGVDGCCQPGCGAAAEAGTGNTGDSSQDAWWEPRGWGWGAAQQDRQPGGFASTGLLQVQCCHVCVLTLWCCCLCVCVRTGVFAWVAGPLKAGTRCMLVYNCRSGPLAFTNSAKLHLGYDGWYNKEKQVGVEGAGGHTRVGVSERAACDMCTVRNRSCQ